LDETAAGGRPRPARRKARQVRWAACGVIRRERESLRSGRGAFFFWLLFFWASKRKVTRQLGTSCVKEAGYIFVYLTCPP